MKHVTLILLGWMIFSQPANSIAQEENYDAVYQSLTKEYTWNEDGTIDFRLSKALKLQNYRSFHRLYGETFIVYNPGFQQLEINQAYTIMADGKKVLTPKNAFNEVLPRAAAQAPAFNQLRETVVTHTGLEIGATIFLDYQIHTQTGFFPAFMGTVLLAEEQPVKSLTVVIRTPLDKPVYTHLFNGTTEPEETVEKNFRVYTWVLKDIPAMESEKLQPDPYAIYPIIAFSSLNTYQPLVDFFMGQKAFDYQANSQMDGFVERLVTENQTNLARVFAIQESVVKEINLFDIPEEIIGYRLRPPAEVWNSNGGTVGEKAVLMAALLKKSGINSEPVLIFQGHQFDHTIGNLACLKEWAVKTEIPETGIIYLSVKQANAFDMTVLDPQDVFMVLEKDKKVQLVYPEPGKTVLILKEVFVIDPELTVSGELNGTLTGTANPFLALLRSEEKLKYYFHGGISSSKLSGIKLQELTAGKTSFSCVLGKANGLTKDSNMYSLTLPYFSTGIENWDVGQLPTQRQNPVEIPSGFRESFNMTLAIPENLKLISAEQEIRIQNSLGLFLFLVQKKENTLQIRKEIEITKKIIGTEDYPAFKELLDNWSIWQTNNVLFTR